MPTKINNLLPFWLKGAPQVLESRVLTSYLLGFWKFCQFILNQCCHSLDISFTLIPGRYNCMLHIHKILILSKGNCMWNNHISINFLWIRKTCISSFKYYLNMLSNKRRLEPLVDMENWGYRGNTTSLVMPSRFIYNATRTKLVSS